MTKDMTQGSPLKLLLAFAVPLMLGSLFQQFYNLADTIIVGRFVGVEALAAVGSVGGLNYLVLGFVNGIACGFSIPISWHLRRPRPPRDAPLHRQYRVAVHRFCHGAHHRYGGYDPSGAGVDEHPGRYHRPCGYLYPHHFCRHPLHPAL